MSHSVALKTVFSIQFKAMLAHYNLTAAAYAREIGYSPRSAQYWARGEATPPLEVIGEVLLFSVPSIGEGSVRD